MDTTLHEKSNKMKCGLNFFRKMVGMLSVLLFIGNVNAQDEITLSVTPGDWVGSVSPATLTDGGAVVVTLIQHQCQLGNLSIKVNGVEYPVVAFGNTEFSTTNGFTLSNTSGGNGALNIGANASFCDWQTTGFSFTVYLDFTGEEIRYSAEASFPPKISVNQASLNPFRTCSDRASETQTFEVAGRDLTNNIEVKPLAGYEYSTNNTDFDSSLSIAPVDGRVQQTIYVRLTAGNEDESTPGGQIECATSGTASKFVTVSGSVIDIAGIETDVPENLIFEYREGNNPSEAMSFAVSACLTEEITVNAPDGFEVSKDGTVFSDLLTLSSTGGTVWVRMNAVAKGVYGGDILIETTEDGIDAKAVAVNGTVEMYDCVNHPYTLVLDRVTGTICAFDECDAIFELNVETVGEGQYYAQLSISKADGEDIRLSTVGLPGGVQVEYAGNNQLVFRNVGNRKFTFYVDMRNPNNNVITMDRPVLEKTSPFVKIDGKTTLAKCEELNLEAFVCPNDLAAGYRWYRNNELIAGGNSVTLHVDSIITEAVYSVEVLDENGDVLGSSAIPIFIEKFYDLPNPEITSESSSFIQLNEVEHQINQGDKFYFNVELTEDLNFDNYVLQGKSLHVDSFWVDLKTVEVQGSDISVEITALEGMLYRLKAFDDGICSPEHFSGEALIRVRFECISENPADTLFYDDFGYFKDSITYVYKDASGVEQEYSGTINGAPVENFWAPDPYASNSNTFEPDGHVRKHKYALFDPTDWAAQDWCNTKYRINDRHYAIVANPQSADCDNTTGHDFWNGTDHTGNVNGGMLFINCADEPGTVLYSRNLEVKDACKGVKVLFSAYISNATIKGADSPVNIRLDIWDKNRTKLIYSISSGDVLIREESGSNKWANLSFKFDVMDETEYLLELTNNNPGGENLGNDLLLDDILVTVCYPSVTMLVDGKRELNISTCAAEESYELCATPEPVLVDGQLVELDLKEYIPTPNYAFKYTDANGNSGLLAYAGGDTISTDSCISIRLADFPHGTMEIVLLVASTPDLIRNILANPAMESCNDNVDFFIRDTIWMTYKPFEPINIDTVVCPETPIPLPNLKGIDNMKWWNLFQLGSTEPIDGMFMSDSIDIPNETDHSIISAILMDSLEKRYQRYMENPANVPLNGEPREFNFTFGTFLGCVYDGSGEPSIIIKLSKLPRMTNITAEVDGKSIMIAGNVLQSDTVRVCSDGSKVINVRGDMTAEPDYQWEWVWQLKETGEELSRNNGSYELIKNGNIPNEGILIVRTSFEHECTDTLEIPFKFYDPFEVTLEISTDSKGQELCLSSEAGEEVTLTAGIKPENRKPEPIYYWYESFNGAPFVEMEGNPTSEITKTRLIGKNENGKYSYKVVAIDNICFTSYGAATEGENVGENFFNAYKPIGIKGIVTSAAGRGDTVCVGDELTFTATIENPRAGVNYEWTSTHEGSPKTGSFSVTETTTTITFTIGEVLGKGQVTLSITDGLCGDTVLSKNYYTFTLVEKPEIQEVGDWLCVKIENQTVKLQVEPTVGALKYEWYKKGSNNILGEGTTVDAPLIPNGGNTFYVKAIGECDADSNEITITTREPLVLSNLNVTKGTLTTCAFEAPEVCLEITPSLAQSWSYQWEILEENDTIYQTSNENTKCLTIPLGTKGQVRVSVFDELCDMNVYSQPKDYDIRDNISIELIVKDINGLPISDGWLCEDSVILEAKILAGGTTGGYTWTWFDNGTEVKKEQNQPTPRQIKLTQSLWEYSIEATKTDACGDQKSKMLGTNLIMPIQPTISVKGTDRNRFCSTDKPLELEVTVDGGLDLSNVSFEWWSVNGGSITGNGTLATYQLPHDFNYSSDVSVAVKATYGGDRGSSVCSQNTAILDLTIQNPIEIKMRENKKGEYDICLDDPYREVELIVDIFDGRPDSLYWHKNGLLDSVSAVNGLDSIIRIVKVANSEWFTVLAKDSICGDKEDIGGVEISVTRVPDFKLIIEPDVIEINQNTHLSAIINDSITVADSTYTWKNDLGWETGTLEYQTNSGYMSQEGIYTFSVTTKFGNCYLTTSADLEVLELLTNIITPYDRNGKNDVFMGPKGKRPGYKMEIFNRYQQKIFEGNNGWDGTYRGQFAEPGTYFYRIEMQSGRVMKGTVEVAKF